MSKLTDETQAIVINGAEITAEVIIKSLDEKPQNPNTYVLCPN